MPLPPNRSISYASAKASPLDEVSISSNSEARPPKSRSRESSSEFDKDDSSKNTPDGPFLESEMRLLLNCKKYRICLSNPTILSKLGFLETVAFGSKSLGRARFQYLGALGLLEELQLHGNIDLFIRDPFTNYDLSQMTLP